MKKTGKPKQCTHLPYQMCCKGCKAKENYVMNCYWYIISLFDLCNVYKLIMYLRSYLLLMNSPVLLVLSSLPLVSLSLFISEQVHLPHRLRVYCELKKLTFFNFHSVIITHALSQRNEVWGKWVGHSSKIPDRYTPLFSDTGANQYLITATKSGGEYNLFTYSHPVH